jgi:hypothetical protein
MVFASATNHRHTRWRATGSFTRGTEERTKEMKSYLVRGAIALICAGLACDVDSGAVTDDEHGGPDESEVSSGKADSVRPGTALLVFEFDGELVTDSADTESAIHNQLLYSIGQLNGDDAVGRLDAVELTDVSRVEIGGGRAEVSYHARLSVGWTRGSSVPQTYTLALPRDTSWTGLQAFTDRYASTCFDLWSAHDVSVGNYWYYYRSQPSDCDLDESDTVFATATVSDSPDLSPQSYPEYDEIWADDTLRAVVIFGKDVPGSTSISDFGIAQYGRFNYLLRLWGLNTPLSSTPEDILQAPGVENPDVTWRGEYEDGRDVEVTVLLIDSPRHADAHFETRYHELSATADVIIYNGHAALGDNVRALSRLGDFQPGQYTIVSMMGCDTYAYVDGYMAQQRAALNPDDPNGTKYLDMITNLTPTNPTQLPAASMELLRALVDVDRPSTYTSILNRFEFGHYPIVTGDQDNAFAP